jgi:hypothetical protein
MTETALAVHSDHDLLVDYKGGYKFASKIIEEGFEAELYTKH